MRKLSEDMAECLQALFECTQPMLYFFSILTSRRFDPRPRFTTWLSLSSCNMICYNKIGLNENHLLRDVHQLDCPIKDAAAEDFQIGLYDKVKKREASERCGKELPGFQDIRQVFLVVGLEVVDHHNCKQSGTDERDKNIEQSLVSNQREREVGTRQNYDNEGDVEEGEPLVLQHLAAPYFSQEQGPPHERNHEEEKEPKYVDEAVNQGDLESRTAVSMVGSQGNQDAEKA